MLESIGTRAAQAGFYVFEIAFEAHQNADSVIQEIGHCSVFVE
jgi:hypothetical protein